MQTCRECIKTKPCSTFTTGGQYSAPRGGAPGCLNGRTPSGPEPLLALRLYWRCCHWLQKRRSSGNNCLIHGEMASQMIYWCLDSTPPHLSKKGSSHFVQTHMQKRPWWSRHPISIQHSVTKSLDQYNHWCLVLISRFPSQFHWIRGFD